jgi:hypothetical protein
MKTKLLRKVKQRYEIFRVDEINDDDSATVKDFVKTNGLPYFILKINSDKHPSLETDSVTFIRGYNYLFTNRGDAIDEIRSILYAAGTLIPDRKKKFKKTNLYKNKVW